MVFSLSKPQGFPTVARTFSGASNQPANMAAAAPSGLACSQAPDHRSALVPSISLARVSTSETHNSVEKQTKKEEREREKKKEEKWQWTL